ncbi:MAG: hypothetical protein M3Y56_01020 [Armatimonadota bacterium]|nr:hypothetical protein [Armatimonadota bacterium]
MAPLDEKFIHRVYRTSLIVGAILALGVWGRWGFQFGLGLAAGVLIDLACLWTIEFGVRRFIRPGTKDYRPLLLLAGGMYPALLVALWILVQSPWVNVPALAAGVTLPNAVIVLKVVGRNLAPRMQG